jgi:predicted ATPase
VSLDETMQSKNPRWVVIIGAPGSGKTTILNYIKASGYHVEPEAARVVIQKQLQQGNPVLPWTDRVAFDRLILPVLREAFERARPGQTVFYDRGLPDLIGWALYEGLDPSFYLTLAKQYRYEHTAYFALGDSSYEANIERPYTFDQAQLIYENLVQGYRMAEYNVCSIPASKTGCQGASWLLSKLGLRSWARD